MLAIPRSACPELVSEIFSDKSESEVAAPQY